MTWLPSRTISNNNVEDLLDATAGWVHPEPVSRIDTLRSVMFTHRGVESLGYILFWYEKELGRRSVGIAILVGKSVEEKVKDKNNQPRRVLFLQTTYRSKGLRYQLTLPSSLLLAMPTFVSLLPRVRSSPSYLFCTKT